MQKNLYALQKFILEYGRPPHRCELVEENGFNSALSEVKYSPNRLLLRYVQDVAGVAQ